MNLGVYGQPVEMERRGALYVPRGSIDARPGQPVPPQKSFPVSYAGARGEPKTWADERGLAYYTSHVYSACEAIAKREAGLAWSLVVVDRYAGGAETELEDHPFLEIVRKPNPVHSWRMLIHLTSLWRSLTGNAYWLKVRDITGTVRGAWPLLPQLTRVVVGGPELIRGFNFYPQGLGRQGIFFPRSEVIHFRLPNPHDYLYGFSRVRAAAYDIDASTAMDTYEATWFRNQARADYAIATAIEGPNASAQLDTLLTNILIHHQGADNWGLPLLLPKDSTIEKIDYTATDMQWIQRAVAKRDDILEVLGTSKFMLGRYENINRSTSDNAMNVFAQITIDPDMAMMADDINGQLIQVDYEAERGLHLEARYENPVREDSEFQIKKRESDLKLGVVTIDEVRSEDGRDPYADGIGAHPLVPNSYLPLRDVVNGTGRAAPKTVVVGAVPGGSAPVDDGSPKAGAKDTASADGETKRSLPMVIRPSLRTDAERETWWRSHEARLDNLESKLIRIGAPVFADQRERVLRNAQHVLPALVARMVYPDGRPMGRTIRAKKVAEWKRDEDELDALIRAIFDRSTEDEIVKAGFGPIFRAIYKAGGAAGALDLGVVFDVASLGAAAWLRSETARFADEVNGTTGKAIFDALADGVEAGDTLNALIDRISALWDPLTRPEGYRIRNIARTEVTGAYNAGRIESWKHPDVAGIIGGGQWISVRDQKVRDSHQLADGEIVPLGQLFSNGCEFPGDPRAPAKERCGCRCLLREVLNSEIAALFGARGAALAA